MHENNEIDVIVKSIHQKPHYIDPDSVFSNYSSYNLQVLRDPFNVNIIQPIITALKNEIPFSVIRIGDGEANILTYDEYPETPILNNKVFLKIISMQQDSFKPSKSWMNILKDMMMGAILQADIIGVIGLWRVRTIDTNDLVEMLHQDHRGISGHWRAIDHMLTLANQGYFNNKIIASAHLYFSVAGHLDTILPHSKNVLIISNRSNVVISLKSKYPECSFSYIQVGNPCSTLSTHPDHPSFLSKVYYELPLKMSGYLCLIGAGPWSEIYCSWVKQRGGVAVDIGSGFDLLDGELTRPIHKKVHNKIIKKLKL